MYEILENLFNVIYPNSENATYNSDLNFSNDLHTAFQKWYRYKEGYSLNLVKKIIKEYMKYDKGLILDPFCGSGSTLLAARELGYDAIGFEVNPFSHFLSHVKLTNYSSDEIYLFIKSYRQVIETNNSPSVLPNLSFSDKVFQEEVQNTLMIIKNNILALSKELNYPKVINLLKLGWLACVEDLSEYRKAGNGLKRRKSKNPRKLNSRNVVDKLENQYFNMYEDLVKNNVDYSASIILDSCINMDKYLKESSVAGIIFSPPYANCFDYTEIYKLELWFGDFVMDYKELKKMRYNSIRSHLNSNLKEKIDDYYTLDELDEIIKKLEAKKLWDKRLPQMIKYYFHDMFVIINKSYKLLQQNGFCNIIVSNSSYGGVIIPTDLLFARYAQYIGFKVDKIVVDRYIITSSQQYELTKENKKYLRESMVCLIKE